MPITVRIPGPLRSATGGAGKLTAQAGPLRDILAQLGAAHPGLLPRLFETGEELKPVVRVFVGEEDIRALQGLATVVPEGSTVAIVLPVAGA